MTLGFAPEKIETWPLERLRPYAQNAKTHGANQVARIAASIAEFGTAASTHHARSMIFFTTASSSEEERQALHFLPDTLGAAPVYDGQDRCGRDRPRF